MHAWYVVALQKIVGVGLPVAFHTTNRSRVKDQFFNWQVNERTRKFIKPIHQRTVTGIESNENQSSERVNENYFTFAMHH